MKTAPSPAFMFYASDIMADKRYRLMELHERGLLITLKCECWVNGSAPADPDELAKWLGFAQEKIKSALTQRVLEFFKIGDGELIDPAIDRYLLSGAPQTLKPGRNLALKPANNCFDHEQTN